MEQQVEPKEDEDHPVSEGGGTGKKGKGENKTGTLADTHMQGTIQKIADVCNMLIAPSTHNG